MMRLILVALLLAACEGNVNPMPIISAPNTQACAATPPVYHPARLKLLEPCVIFRGVVLADLKEPDGDRHLWLAPDPGFEKYLNAANIYRGQKALVAEIVPTCSAEPPDEEAAAQCPVSKLGAPIPGSHIEISGPWVLDTAHGWQEVHPISTLKILPRSTS